MGLFSSKKVTYVDSVVYNMAGDEDQRVNYLKATTIRNVMNRAPSLGEALNKSYINGPGIKLRGFYRWALNHFPIIGIPGGSLNATGDIDIPTLQQQIPHSAGQTVNVEYAEITRADYGNWGEKWMIENYPALLDSDWATEYNEQTHQITVHMEDGSVHVVNSSGFNPDSRYLYVVYRISRDGWTDDVVTGSTTTVFDPADLPDTSTFTLASDDTIPHVSSLTTTVRTEVSYSDGSTGSDNTVTSQSNKAWEENHKEYTRKDFLGEQNDGDYALIVSRLRFLYIDQTGAVITKAPVVTTQTEDMSNGVTKTTKVTTTAQDVQMIYKWRLDNQDINEIRISNLRAFIYRIGDSNQALNNLAEQTSAIEGNFFPFIPVRLNNEFLSETFEPDAYHEAKKAYKKAIGASYDDLIEKIGDNEKIDDIDFAFIVFGVSLNVKENACRAYLYEFFKNLLNTQRFNYSYYESWFGRYQQYLEAKAAYDKWLQTGQYRGAPAPTVPLYPALNTAAQNSVTMVNNSTISTRYSVTIRWNYVRELFGVGKAKPDAKVGDYWFENMSTLSFPAPVADVKNPPPPAPRSIPRSRLYYQYDDNAWSCLELAGFYHLNYVYNGKYTETSMTDALNDDEESGFIVPLHYNTFKSISLVQSTQMSTACVFLVLNCYQVKKIRWYQRGIFKIIFVVVFAIVAAVFTGGAGFGLLGANIALGTSLGFAGLTAAIVGSVVNALAAVVLTSIIQYASTALFGEQFGALIGAVLSFVVFNVAMSFQSLGSFNWNSLLRVDNLMKLTDALVNGYSAYLKGQANEMLLEGQQVMNDYEKRRDEIQDLYTQNIGYANEVLDPFGYSQAGVRFAESSDTFLTRTLMTGSDIANLSNGLLTDFAELTLKLPNAYT